jgi:hypothetical protein
LTLTDVSEVLSASIIKAMMMESVGTRDTSVCVNDITPRCIPDGHHLDTVYYFLLEKTLRHRNVTVARKSAAICQQTELSEMSWTKASIACCLFNDTFTSSRYLPSNENIREW